MNVQKDFHSNLREKTILTSNFQKICNDINLSTHYWYFILGNWQEYTKQAVH